MANEFPTAPEVLADATPYSLNDLAIMSPEEMPPEAELAYINLLREQRERYERALGQKATKAKTAASPKAKVAAVLAGPADADAEDLF